MTNTTPADSFIDVDKDAAMRFLIAQDVADLMNDVAAALKGMTFDVVPYGTLSSEMEDGQVRITPSTTRDGKPSVAVSAVRRYDKDTGMPSGIADSAITAAGFLLSRAGFIVEPGTLGTWARVFRD